jgi:hypothetical protein
MKLPRGFGKNYFSLHAITVTVNSVTMHQSATAVQHFHMQGTCFAKEDETTQELEECEAAPWFELANANKACHCSCFFLATTRKILSRLREAKKYQNYYKTLNSAISPPLFFSTL